MDRKGDPLRRPRREVRSRIAPGLLLALGIPCALGAQQRVPVADAPGWVGFWYEVVADARGRPIVVVDRVEADSPAQRSGLGWGDTLLAVNGEVFSPESFRMAGASLKVGDAVRLTVRRNGRHRDVDVVAAPRPHGLAVTLERVPERAPAPPSAATAARSVRVARPAPDVRGRAVLEPPPPAPERGQSFQVFVWSAADSLTDRLRSLEAQERVLRTAELRRLQELTAQGGRGRHVDTPDPVLVDQRKKLDAVRRQSEALRATIEASARERARVASVRAAPPFRPLTPYIAGQDRVAGAQLTPLNDGLAVYFGASRGLLVVEVGAGTPAEEAGLEPGDVLLAVAGVPVAGMDELRSALGRATSRPVALQLLRRGRRFEASLP